MEVDKANCYFTCSFHKLLQKSIYMALVAATEHRQNQEYINCSTELTRKVTVTVVMMPFVQRKPATYFCTSVNIPAVAVIEIMDINIDKEMMIVY